MSEITPTNSTPLNISGIVLNILPLQTGTSKAGNQWQKQDFILETGGQYPRKVCICLFGDNVEKFPLAVGQSVTASVDIESREFNGRWYTDVRAWNVVYNGQQQGAPAPAPTGTAPTAQPAPTPAKGATAQAPAGAPAAADDLPF
nr:MAG TPA: Single-stranded DNA-binding protein/DNA complex, OB fold, beta-barrel, single-stranded [Caudoviricetes sp.]